MAAKVRNKTRPDRQGEKHACSHGFMIDFGNGTRVFFVDGMITRIDLGPLFRPGLPAKPKQKESP